MTVRVPKTLLIALVLLSLGTFTPGATGASVVYSYDQLGRVTTALYDNGLCIAYSYDVNGNRTSQTNTLSGTPGMPTWGSGVWGCFPWTPQ
jgi:YD repeat-containing protein